PASHCRARGADGGDDVLGSGVAGRDGHSLPPRHESARAPSAPDGGALEGRVPRARHRPLSDAERAGGAHAPAAGQELSFGQLQDGRITALPVVCVSKSLYAASACWSLHRCVKSFSTSTFWSAMNSAHSAWPCFENVQDPTSVTCRRSRSGLTSSVTWPRSPTKHAVPHERTARTAAARASGAEEASSVLCAPSPWVRSRIAATTSPDVGSITSCAPNA